MTRIHREIVHVPMRDGVRLSVHIHRPAGKARVPAILMYTPYRKGPLGKPHPIVKHGYATVTFDVRGTGNSEGATDSVYSDAERQDGYDMVEWAAAQPWCNGNVGMWGISYGAVAALQIAAAAPPHLKAIIARSGSDDPFTEWTNPGGFPRPFIHMTYSPIMTASNFCPPDPAEVGARWQKMWRDRLRHNVPWGIPFVRHLEDGPFWRARAIRGKYHRVKCAVFVVDGWADWYATPLLRIFSKLKSPKRALIGPWSHEWPDVAVPGPQIDWLHECRKWFGYWLKGEDTGVMDEPPVALFVRDYIKPASFLRRDHGTFRCEHEWPLKRAVNLNFPLGAAVTLKSDPLAGKTTGMHGGGPYSVNSLLPLDQRPDEVLTFTTTPLPCDVEVTGQPQVKLRYHSNAPVTQLCVKLCDVAPDGTSALVTKGYGQELLACAYRIRKGHRIRVSIAGGDFLNIWPAPTPATITIDKTSRLILPVIPSCRQPAPKLRLLPARKRQFVKPDFSATGNTVRYTAEYGKGWTHRAKYTVSTREPAKAIVDSESERVVGSIATHAHTITRSDAKFFQHEVTVTVRVAGKLKWKRRWKVRTRRRELCGV